MVNHKLAYFLLAALSIFTSLAYSQELPDTSANLQANAPTVFIDCGFCDENYIRTEIAFVNYVRDRLLADVHVLITTQSTGGGGREYTLTFIGQHRSAGMNDTLTFTTRQSDTQDMIRSSLVHHLKIGLVRYISKTPLAQHLVVSYRQPSRATDVVDRWDYWTFSINMNTNLNGQKASSFVNLFGGLSARRITQEWKIRFSLNANYNESSFTYEVTGASGTTESITTKSFSRGQNFNALVVRSITDHWSFGGFGSAFTSTYANAKLNWSLAPALEYNLFPYSQSTRQQLRFLYRIGYTSARYYEETIFDRTQESLWNQSLSVSLDLRQPWGSVNATVEGSHYLHDFEKRRLSVSTGLSLRLIEGLSLNLFGNYSRINDQLALRKGRASQEEVLLQRRQLATNYNYSAFVGLSYTFGSIYNNIVNPRFGDSGGGVSYYFSID
jgi:hypothetical protein